MATGISEDERCIALTAEGKRCKRIATDSAFCYQHVEGCETITIGSGSENELRGLSRPIAGQSASSVESDIRQNLSDIREGLSEAVISLVREEDTPKTVIEALQNTIKTAPKTTVLGGAGMVAGSALGPLGIAAGGTAGLWVGYYFDGEGDQALVGIPVTSVPEHAEITSSTHDSIANLEPVQLVLESTVESGESDWVRNTRTRHRDMEEVEQVLSSLPFTDAEEPYPSGYYVYHEPTETTIVLVLGTPLDQ